MFGASESARQVPGVAAVHKLTPPNLRAEPASESWTGWHPLSPRIPLPEKANTPGEAVDSPAIETRAGPSAKAVDTDGKATVVVDPKPAAGADSPTARRVELSAGVADTKGKVTVLRATVDTGKKPVVISDSRGIQIGDKNRMENAYKVRLEKPTASVNGFLDGNAEAQRALGRLAENPGSRSAAKGFQQALTPGPLLSGGKIEAGKFTGPGTQRVPVHGTGGPVVIDRSAGIQLGDHGIMRNRFNYAVARPQVSVESALRSDLDLACSFATAVRYPGVPAAQHAFANNLERVITQGCGGMAELRGTYSGLFPNGVTGDGVQVGIDNTRVETVQFEARGFTFIGCREPGEPVGRTPEGVYAAMARATEAVAIDHMVPATAFGQDQGSRPPEIALVSLPSSPGNPGSRPMGAVVCGSTAAIRTAAKASGRPLDADLVLGYVCRRLREDLRHGPIEDVQATFRALTGLRTVTFLDSGTGDVLWVDVGQGRQAPEVTFLRMKRADGPDVRFSLSSPQPTTSDPQPAHLPDDAADLRAPAETLRLLRSADSLMLGSPEVAEQLDPASPWELGMPGLDSM